jgi:hypothetical protein
VERRLLPNNPDLKDNQPHVEVDPYPVEVEQYEPWILRFVEPSLPQTDQYPD